MIDITQFLKSLIHHDKLETIILESNGIMELSGIIGDLSSLRKLNLMRNNLETFPESIDALKRLEELDLEGNMIKSLLDSIKSLKSLKKLNIKRNPFCRKPDENIKLFLEKLRENGVDVLI